MVYTSSFALQGRRPSAGKIAAVSNRWRVARGSVESESLEKQGVREKERQKLPENRGNPPLQCEKCGK